MTMRIQDAPTPAQQPTVAVTVLPPVGIPQPVADLATLRAQRAEINTQLSSAQGRRDDIVEQLTTAAPVERPGLEARLKFLDDRIITLEGDLQRVGQQMSQLPGAELTSESQPPVGGGPLTSGDITGIAIVFTLFVLAPLAFTMARIMWRRATATPPKLDTAMADRMQRLEEGIDTIAIEVERISEGQRFVTRLLSDREKQATALPRE
jgi:hypothetical protein